MLAIWHFNLSYVLDCLWDMARCSSHVCQGPVHSMLLCCNMFPILIPNYLPVSLISSNSTVMSHRLDIIFKMVSATSSMSTCPAFHTVQCLFRVTAPRVCAWGFTVQPPLAGHRGLESGFGTITQYQEKDSILKCRASIPICWKKFSRFQLFGHSQWCKHGI